MYCLIRKSKKLKKRRILCVQPSSDLYGADRSFLSTVDALISKEHVYEITVAISSYGPLYDKLKELPINIEIRDVGSVALWYAKKHPFISLWKILKSAFHAFFHINKFDVIYMNTIVSFGYLVSSFFSFKSKIIHIREIPSKIQSTIFSFIFLLARIKPIYNSYATMKSFLLFSKNSNTVLYNAVDPISGMIKQECSFDFIAILLIGRISERKGHFFFLDTLKMIDKEKLKKLKIRIVGSTPPRRSDILDNLFKMISDYSLGEFVSICDYTDAPSIHYSWADIVIVPSVLPESFGRVAIEAMSLGKAVIAANHGGLSEIVVDNKTGWLFPPSDAKALAELLESVVSDRSLIYKYGLAGKERYENMFTMDIYRNNFLKIFSRMVN